MKKILLLSMPMGALERQALGLSLFKARFTDEGIPCDVRYLTFAFADLIGVEDYCWLSTDIPHTAFAGEWVFTSALYGPNSYAQANYTRDVLQGIWQLDEVSIERILRAQAMAPIFIEHFIQAIPWRDYAAVGFTSTFEQNIASLALAKRIKSEHPDVKIVFGGANWEGEMGLELHRRFSFVDYAFSGEADESFPRFVRLALSGRLRGKAFQSIPGLIRRFHGESILSCSPDPVQNLDDLPVPDYSDYFRDLENGSANSVVVPTLLFEGSRGCWWGAKHHCMFCGLNGATMKFRAKTPKRAFQEIQQLVDRWQIGFVQAVDNVVPANYFRECFPMLAQAERPERIFYEVRANMSRENVKALREGRVLHVQPGIESFSNHMLQLMNKGTTALQNIQVLKWCREYGVQADYNILYGFPGETDDDYQNLFQLLKAIRFLNPPTACGPIRLDRFSPYYREAINYGFQNIRPLPPYKYIYPFGDESVRRIAYYFDYDPAPGTTRPERSRELASRIEEWKNNPETGSLQAFERPDGALAILDTRSHKHRSSIVLQGRDKAVYDYCDRERSLASICDYLASSFPGARLGKDAVLSFLDALVDHEFMIRDGSGYLSLALRTQLMENAESRTAREPLVASMQRM
jgi:ribosomal peptide maturation radical SAM protein 1